MIYSFPFYYDNQHSAFSRSIKQVYTKYKQNKVIITKCMPTATNTDWFHFHIQSYKDCTKHKE
jgi:hypothetical protein